MYKKIVHLHANCFFYISVLIIDVEFWITFHRNLCKKISLNVYKQVASFSEHFKYLQLFIFELQ